jgi:hypothetical protein
VTCLEDKRTPLPYHMNVLDELVCMKLKEKCLILEVTSVAEDIEALTM